LRNVTQDDYLVRALSMPAKYGVVSKAYIEPTKAQSISAGESNAILDLYVLTFDINNKLNIASTALKQNMITYLSQYRMINDSINIKDGYIVNIGVNFDIMILPNYNSNDVLTRCITALQTYFAIDNWQINQPIILRELYILLDKVEGVQTVKSINISNKVGVNLGYSQWAYDMSGATKNNVVYPSLDPMIFEVKFPSTDIQGRVVSL
jgi:phage-related baseplate assembly protein